MAAAAEPLAPDEQSDPRQQTDRNSSGGTDPIILERVFQEIGDSDQDGDNADAVEPILSNLFFKPVTVPCGG